MKTLFLLIGFYISTGTCFAEDSLRNLWKNFYIEAKNHDFSEPVKMYEVNTSNTVLFFIYKNNVYFFKDGKIEKPDYAKLFNVDGVNRISFKESEFGGTFMLWSNETVVMQFGI